MIILFIEPEGEIYCVDVENVTLTFCVDRDMLVSVAPPLHCSQYIHYYYSKIDIT